MNWKRTGRKIISTGLAVFMIVLGGFPGIGLEKAYAAGGEFAGGSGSAENPYQITKLEQLSNIRNYLDKHFILMNNLDFNLDTDYEDSANKTAWTTGTGWTPIGTIESPFTGVLDGGGHTISGLMISPARLATPYTFGLFASINSGAEIKNLALKDVNIPYKMGYSVKAGGLVCECGGSVTNCSVSGTVAGSTYVGGLVGTCTGTISNSYSTATVIGYNLKGSPYKRGITGGGLVGVLSGASAEITGSYFSGTISSFSFEGGLVGKADGSTLSNCYSTGNLTDVITDGGGLVGVADKATVRNCYALGSIQPYTYPVGGNQGGLIGNVLGTTSIEYCYSAGSVAGNNPSGLIGLLGGTGNTLTSCYYNSGTSGCSDTDKGTPKTSAEMRTAGTFTAWDFGTAWDIVNTETNCSYPYLRSNAQNPEPGYTDKVRIVTQPQNAAATVGGNAGLSVEASGAGLTYQWQINTGSGFENISNGGKYSGADTAALSITDFEAGMAGYVYRVIVTGAEAPAATSDSAVLTQAESAGLTGLTLSGSPVNFTFSGNTYTYNGITVENAVASITVTPIGDGTITVDGTNVATGTTSAGIALTEGVEKVITITVRETGKSVKTYTLKVTRLTGNQPPIAKATVPVQYVHETESVEFRAADIAEDPDNDPLSITQITTMPNSSTASADIVGNTVKVTGIASGTTSMIVTVRDTRAAVDVTVPIVVTTANTTSLALTATPAGQQVAGNPVTLTATLTGFYAGPGVSGQAITFKNGETTFGTANLNSGGVATYTWTPGTGTYSLTAEYAATAYNTAAASSAVSYTVIADPDIAAVAAAKNAAQSARYANMTQVATLDENAIKMVLRNTAEVAVNNSGVTITINQAGYTAPISGTSANPSGTNGSYVFTVTVSKGSQSETTGQKTIVITATPYTGGNGGNGNTGDGSDTPSKLADKKPTEPVTGSAENNAAVDGKGNASVSLTDNNITDAIADAKAEAAKKGVNAGEITAVIHVTTDGKSANTVMINLPKSTQEQIIGNRISNIQLVIDHPDIVIGIDLAAVTEINRQAKADVQLSATRMDNTKLSADAIATIGNRPAYDLKATYGGKYVTDFGKGSIIVEIPYTLQEGEIAGNVYAVYVDAKGKVTYLTDSSYDEKRGTVVFSTSHFSTYGVACKASFNFTDINTHWAKDDILFVANRGLMTGTRAATFSPNASMTRGMFVTVLGRLANADINAYKQSGFTDVKADAYYMGYIGWGVKNNILVGIGGDKFDPDGLVTREQMAVIMDRYAAAIGFKLPEVHRQNIFVDNARIGAWAALPVKRIQMAGIIQARSNNLYDPQGTATRAEVSAVLRRFVELEIFSNAAHG